MSLAYSLLISLFIYFLTFGCHVFGSSGYNDNDGNGDYNDDNDM